MKKIVLLLLTVSWLAQAVEVSELRNRKGQADQKESQLNQRQTIQDKYIAANRQMAVEWAKKSNSTHFVEGLKDSPLLICMGFTNLVTAAALYALYSYLQQSNE